MTSQRTDVFDKKRSEQNAFVRVGRHKLLLGALLAFELLVLSVAYTNNFDFVCRDSAPAVLCEFLSKGVLRSFAFLGVIVILALAQKDILVELTSPDENESKRYRWFWVQLAGFGFVIAPWIFLDDSSTRGGIAAAFGLWVFGGLIFSFATGLAAASVAKWRKIIGRLGPISAVFLIASIFAPEIADFAGGIWKIEPLTRATFHMVVATLDLFGVAATARPEEMALATDSFTIEIGYQCSGVEGFALITFFLLCYFYAFADDLRFPLVWILLPVSLLLSWMLNVARIAGLFAIGVHISPSLAINGFHSHAGWLVFTVLALSVIGVSRTVTVFKNTSDVRVEKRPLRKDWLAARILPFAIFMGASLLLSTFTEVPELWYGLKVAAMIGGLLLFLPFYLRLQWRIDPLAISVGVAIGLIWIAGSLGGATSDAPLDAALANLPLSLLVAWVLLRMTGTVLLVPMIEELFFRGYVLDRIDRGEMALRIVALIVSAGLFAALHDKWLLAGIAGLAYGLVYVRKKHLTDAVVAHASSNLVIALYAIWNFNWSII